VSVKSKIFGTALSMVVGMGWLSAEAKSYDFADPKGVNAVSVFLDSPLEPIYALAKDLSGSFSFDTQAPMKTSGKIAFPITSLEFTNPKMTKIAQGKSWLNAKAFGDVVYEIKRVVSVRKEGDVHILNTDGQLLLKGMTLPLNTELHVSHIADGASQRGGAKSGDLLVVRSSFSIDRGAYNIKPGDSLAKVGNEIEIKVAIAGYEKL
jgi:polyisoprenoid-binding protein YceI